jgi:DNA polymerase III subunit gamma/tau
LLDDGHDLRRFTLDLVQHARDLLVLQVAPDDPDLVDATDERRRRLLAQTTLVPADRLLRMVDLLAATVAEQRHGSPRLPLELALARLAVPGADGELAALADRVAALESGGSPATGRRTPIAPRRGTSPPPIGGTSGTEEPTPAPTAADATAEEPSPHAPAPAVGDAPTADTPDETADPPAPAEERPAPVADTPDETAERPDPAPTPADASSTDDDPLTLVTTHWQGILELLKQSSRRHHAIFEPAVPVAVRNHILTLRYAPRYASFHAVQARGGELSGALITALERSCGLKLRIDVEVEGAPSDRRPIPPSVTPDDARTPVLDEPTTSAVDGGEEVDVREAELDRPAQAVDVDQLLQRELGAELLDERPPPALED